MIGWEVTNGGRKPNGDKYSSEELANIGETYIWKLLLLKIN